MDIKDLILNLSVNKEPVAHLPQTSDNGPLVITYGLLESIDSGAVDGRKLVGWKGDVLWTTGAMLWLASKELI